MLQQTPIETDEPLAALNMMQPNLENPTAVKVSQFTDQSKSA